MIDLMRRAAASAPADSKRQAVDTGMALTLVCLLAGLATGRGGWFAAATALLVLAMACPRLYAPAAKVWFGLSAVLGAFMSRLLLTLIFLLLVTPVALLRRAMGKDALLLSRFGQGDGSVFAVRSDPYGPDDLQAPY